jgi:hypothetical protein
MFENLSNTNVAQASEEDLLTAAGPSGDDKEKGKKSGDTKDKNQGDDDGKTKGKKTDGKTDDKSKDKSASGPKKSVSALSSKDLNTALGDQDDDDDDQDDDAVDDDAADDDAGEVPKKKTSKKKKEETSDDDDQDDESDDDNDDEDQDNEDEDKDDDEKDKDDENEKDSGNIDVKDFLKARVDLLIKTGKWYDFEGREDVEWDEETFEQIETKQQEAKEAEIREEMLTSFGPYGSAIAEYAANGGDPEKLIDIFKEQQRVVALSVETEDDQKAVVLKYATEFQKMKPKAAQTYINALIADKELETVAKDAKESMEKELKDQEDALQQEQADVKAANEAKVKSDLQEFSQKVTQVLNSRTDISPEEKKELSKVLTKFDKKLKNGVPVNEFYFKFAEFKKDLPNYIEFVRFVLDPKKFIKSKENKGKTDANEKAFKLVRTGNKSKKAKSSGNPGGDGGSGGKKTTFKLIY